MALHRGFFSAPLSSNAEFASLPLLQSCWIIQEGPGDAEFSGEVGGEGFDAEGFSGVVAAVENIHAEFLRQAVSPVRAFASDESVHAFGGGFCQFATGPARHDADASAEFRPTRDHEGDGSDGALKAPGQRGQRELGDSHASQELAFLMEEWSGAPQSEGGAKLHVVAQARMDIKGQMRAVDGEIGFNQAAEQLVAGTGPRCAWRPEEAVMNEEQFGAGGGREFDG